MVVVADAAVRHIVGYIIDAVEEQQVQHLAARAAVEIVIDRKEMDALHQQRHAFSLHAVVLDAVSKFGGYRHEFTGHACSKSHRSPGNHGGNTTEYPPLLPKCRDESQNMYSARLFQKVGCLRREVQSRWHFRIGDCIQISVDSWEYEAMYGLRGTYAAEILVDGATSGG